MITGTAQYTLPPDPDIQLHEPHRDLHMWVRETLCAARGHDFMLHAERGRRLCLRCAGCGHETPGWHVN